MTPNGPLKVHQRPKLKKCLPCLKVRHGSYLRHDPPRVLIKTRLRHGNRVLAVSNIVSYYFLSLHGVQLVF